MPQCAIDSMSWQKCFATTCVTDPAIMPVFMARCSCVTLQSTASAGTQPQCYISTILLVLPSVTQALVFAANTTLLQHNVNGLGAHRRHNLCFLQEHRPHFLRRWCTRGHGRIGRAGHLTLLVGICLQGAMRLQGMSLTLCNVLFVRMCRFSCPFHQPFMNLTALQISLHVS